MKISKVFSDERKVVDILLLTHNRIECTIECIKSLYKYTPNVFSLTILDNLSTDGTVEYLEKFVEDKKNVNLILYHENTGIVKGRNYAYSFLSLMNMHSNYLFIIDNDQFVRMGWLDSYMRIMDKYDVVGFEGWEMKRDFYPLRRAVKPVDPYHYVSCCGMMINHKVVEDIGLFDNNFSPMFFEDPDFCFRALQRGYTICRNLDPLIFHKPHKLLGQNNEKAKHFFNSWKVFQNKWKDVDLVNLANYF